MTIGQIPKRNRAPSHRDIANVQEELLKWCPNVEDVATDDFGICMLGVRPS